MILPILVLLLWFCGFVVFWKVPLCRKREPGYAECGILSVIIPARNEEDNLPRLLRSLSEQVPQPLEVLVVDDGSTDRTAELAARAGAFVVSSRPLPPGWRGKTWACHQGAAAASGSIFLFVDADTWIEPGGLRRMVDTFMEDDGVISVLPYHETERTYEDLSVYFNLMMAMGVGAFTLLGRRHTPDGLFGQLLMVDAESYRRSGGHEAVKGHTLENMYLADRFRSDGTRMRCFGGRGTVGMRMYPHGAGELVEGWSKAFISGAAKVPVLLITAIVAWITGSVLALAMLVLAAVSYHGTPGYWMLAYPLFCIQTASMAARIGSFNTPASLFYPLPLAFYFAVLTRAAVRRFRGRPVDWKGRPVLPSGRRSDDD